MTDLTPEAQRETAAMNARTYAMTPADRETWFAEHPVSMFAPEPVTLSLDESAESDVAILMAAQAVLQRRFRLFTSDLQQGLANAAEYLKTETESPV
jgi:hypothetical protein